jgi:hypothetical protein
MKLLTLIGRLDPTIRKLEALSDELDEVLRASKPSERSYLDRRVRDGGAA